MGLACITPQRDTLTDERKFPFRQHANSTRRWQVQRHYDLHYRSRNDGGGGGASMPMQGLPQTSADRYAVPSSAHAVGPDSNTPFAGERRGHPSQPRTSFAAASLGGEEVGHAPNSCAVQVRFVVVVAPSPSRMSIRAMVLNRRNSSSVSVNLASPASASSHLASPSVGMQAHHQPPQPILAEPAARKYASSLEAAAPAWPPLWEDDGSTAAAVGRALLHDRLCAAKGQAGTTCVDGTAAGPTAASLPPMEADAAAAAEDEGAGIWEKKGRNDGEEVENEEEEEEAPQEQAAEQQGLLLDRPGAMECHLPACDELAGLHLQRDMDSDTATTTNSREFYERQLLLLAGAALATSQSPQSTQGPSSEVTSVCLHQDMSMDDFDMKAAPPPATDAATLFMSKSQDEVSPRREDRALPCGVLRPAALRMPGGQPPVQPLTTFQPVHAVAPQGAIEASNSSGSSRVDRDRRNDSKPAGPSLADASPPAALSAAAAAGTAAVGGRTGCIYHWSPQPIGTYTQDVERLVFGPAGCKVHNRNLRFAKQ